MRPSHRSISPIVSLAHLAAALLLASAPARSQVVAVGPGAFPAGSTVLTFAGLADGTEVNGLVVSGVTFGYSLGNGNVSIDGGPGITNNVAPQNIVSTGNPTGTLTVTLPGLQNLFGYGFAVLGIVPIVNATTISLFNGATPLGGLSYNGALDPTFPGGFAGIQSVLPFDRVQVTFNASATSAFAIDNIRFAATVATPVPEPAAAALVGLGLGVTLLFRRRTRRTNR